MKLKPVDSENWHIPTRGGEYLFEVTLTVRVAVEASDSDAAMSRLRDMLPQDIWADRDDVSVGEIERV